MWRWFRIGLAAAAVLLLLVAVWTPTPARNPGTASRATVITGAGGSGVAPLVRSLEAPSLLVDRRNSRLVYLSYVDLLSGACRFSVSIDGGRAWRSENAPQLDPWTRNCALGSGHPQNLRTELRQGPDGALYYVFQGNDPDGGGTRGVLLGRSTDSGRTWATTLVDAGPRADAPDGAELDFEGHLAVDPRRPNLLYLMWRRSALMGDPAAPTRQNRPYFAVSTDAGATFGPPTLLVDAPIGTDGPHPVVVGGSVYAFYVQAPPPLPPASATPLPSAPLARLFVAASPDRGRTWARSEIAAARDASEPNPVYDAKRKTFDVVWHDNRNDELDVWYSSSPDAVTWSQPRLLNDDRRGTRVGQHYPQIALGPDGRLDVAWYDWRDDPFPAPSVGLGNVLGTFTNRGKVASVYLTSSRDGGRSWTPNVRVNDELVDRTVGTWANNYDVLAPPAIAATPRGAVVAWSDTRNATVASQSQDLAASVVSFETRDTARVTGLQAALVGVIVGCAVAMWAAVWLMRRPGRSQHDGPRRLAEERQSRRALGHQAQLDGGPGRQPRYVDNRHRRRRARTLARGQGRNQGV